MADEYKGSDSDVDLYYDLDDVDAFNKNFGESAFVNGVLAPDIGTLFTENECDISFCCEDGKTTKIKIKIKVRKTEYDAASQTPVEKDLDLFTDFLDADVTEKCLKAEQEKLERESLILKNVELKKLNSHLEAQLNVLCKKNRMLLRNICALYKTAREEIDRKNKLIAELHEKNDGMLFRRMRLLGTNNGQFSRYTGNAGVTEIGTKSLNEKKCELQTKDQDASFTDLCTERQANAETNCRSNFSGVNSCPKRRTSSDVASVSAENAHNSERKRKLPKAFQDCEKRSLRKYSSHKSYRKRKKHCKITSGKTSSLSEGSSVSDFSDSLSSASESSVRNAADLSFQETLRKLKNSCPRKRRHKTPVLSNEELHRIYSDYQTSLRGHRSKAESMEREKSKFSTSRSGNLNKGNLNYESEESVVSRNNLFKKLLSYERKHCIRQSDRRQKNIELKRIISSASGMEDFAQMYSKYLAQWALSSTKPAAEPVHHEVNADLGDMGKRFSDEAEDHNGYSGDDYDTGYDFYSGPAKYVDLDRPNDDFYGAPPKSFYDHLMEEKARQKSASRYPSESNETSKSVNSSKIAKQCNGEKVLSVSQLPPALKDSFKLFSYQGKPLPDDVKITEPPEKASGALRRTNNKVN